MVINSRCFVFSIDCVPLGLRNRFLLDMRNPPHGLLRPPELAAQG